MVNYAREGARAALMAGYLCFVHPHDTSDATALDNAKYLFDLIDSSVGSDHHITNFMGLHIDYGPEEQGNSHRYELYMSSSFGGYDLGRTSVAVFGRDEMQLVPEKTFTMAIRIPGLTEEMEDLMKLLDGRAPWELDEKESEEWLH